MTLKDKVIVVTGGGSGIGEAVAKLAAAQGAKVVVADRDAVGAERVTKEIGAAAVSCVGDVADPKFSQEMVDLAVKTFGRLDGAVNNAGIGGEQAPVADISIDGWRKTMSVNLDGVFYGIKAEVPAMLKSGGGSIVNIASILGSVGFGMAGAYVATKHAVVGLSRAAAIDYAKQGVRVNSVGPGFINTPLVTASLPPEALKGLETMHPLGRLGESEEVAEVVCFLLSDGASNVTGSYYTVDGGYTAQ